MLWEFEILIKPMPDPDPGDKKAPYPGSAKLLYGHATLGDSRKVIDS